MEVKTTWEYSLETEATRLIHCAHQMAVGFYHVNNFIVLPYNSRSNNALTATFPNLPYRIIPRFWEKAKRVNTYDFPIKVESCFLEQTKNLLVKANLPQPEFQKTKQLWQKAQNEIIEAIYKIMPAKKNLIKEIIIHPTIFGTSCSFGFITKDGKIEMYLREGLGIQTITEAVVTSLTRFDVYKNLGGLWQESELLTDWLVTHSSIAVVLKKYDHRSNFVSTLKGIRTKQQARLLKESDEFYKKLGLSGKEKVFEAKNGVVTTYGKPFENLTAKETEILKLLVKNQNKVVTTDDLADSVFASYDDFSLYAISKTIERLRNKFEANGISGSYIQTLRGQGFILKN